MSVLVYKFRLWAPTANANLVEETFLKADEYYNSLVQIENHRRAEYRTARRILFPEVERLERELDLRQKAVDDAYQALRFARKDSRTRETPQDLVDQLNAAKKLRNETSSALTLAIKSTQNNPVLKAVSSVTDDQADDAAKALRKTLYWGTYLLAEDAIKRAKKDTRGWLKYKSLPLHQRRGRVGIQIQGGLKLDELRNDTRIQLDPSRRRGTFRLRVGTVTGTRKPMWAEFPILLHGRKEYPGQPVAERPPLPHDAVIKWAVVTRTPGHLTRPWTYHLCLTLETESVHRTSLSPEQVGTTTINFGWRQMGDTLRVVTLNNDLRSPEHVDLPVEIYQRFERCRTLQSTIDEHFEVAKKIISTWIANCKDKLPPAFLEAFAGLATWRSPRKLSELVRYWMDHRVPDDADTFAFAWAWRGRWFHLYEWCTCNRQKALRARLDFYRNLAKRIASSSAKLVVEDFDISKVAERPDDDEIAEGGQKARENRTRASVHELRLCILQAAAKHGCELLVVKSQNNTRRCNVCGLVLEWDPAREIVRNCPVDGSRWDQDVNNTDNTHDRVASGEVTTLVEPAKVTDDGEITSPVTSSYRAARGRLDKLAEGREDSEPL